MRVKDRPNLRGGCWLNNYAAQHTTTYFVPGNPAEYSEPYGGFRCFRRCREPRGTP